MTDCSGDVDFRKEAFRAHTSLVVSAKGSQQNQEQTPNNTQITHT